MISVQNVSKTYGQQDVLKDVSFHVGKREKIGLVGRNGHGKTTLFRLITGEEPCIEGNIIIPRDYRIGYLKQDICFTAPTLLEEACLSLKKHQESEIWKAKKILSGLGFTEKDFDRSIREFSGGYQFRIHLAKLLLTESDLLLLDEPTNFLDIISIRWLIRFLNSYRHEFIVISHDRSFMDSVITHIMGIQRMKLRKFSGKTEDYYSQIEKEEEIYEKKRANIEKKHKKQNEFIDRFRAKARRANLVQSRIKKLKKQQKMEKLDKITTLSFSFNAAPFPAKFIMEAKDLKFSYTGAPPYIIENFDLTVGSKDRICIIGKNGKGKTTLMKLLEGTLKPDDGSLWHHPSIKKAYFEQGNTALLRDDLNVEEEIASSQSFPDRQNCRNICGAMMFSGDNALKSIGILSGGEKSRVLLGKLLVAHSNLLLLDEPTHHLDMESSEAIIDSVEEFPGAAIVITHNEEFLYRVARKLIIFHQNGVIYYPGGYADFLEKMGWMEEEDTKSFEDKKEKARLSRKELKRLKAEFINRKSQVLSPLKRDMTYLEKDISEKEQKLDNNTQALITASETQDAAAIAKLSRSLQKIKPEIEILYEKLSHVTEEYEKQEKLFDEEEKRLSDQ